MGVILVSQKMWAVMKKQYIVYGLTKMVTQYEIYAAVKFKIWLVMYILVMIVT